MQRFTRMHDTHRSPCRIIDALFLIGLLCVGIMLQILGAPRSFWNLDSSSDPVASSLLEGLSLVSHAPMVSTSFPYVFAFDTPSPAYQFAAQHCFFHPPLPMG